jgi:hypothetical protein
MSDKGVVAVTTILWQQLVYVDRQHYFTPNPKES